mgnify:CR=1 FL=1
MSTVSKTDKIISAPYVVTPHGTQFKKDVEVTLPINKAVNTDKLAVIYLEDEKDTSWDLLGKATTKDGGNPCHRPGWLFHPVRGGHGRAGRRRRSDLPAGRRRVGQRNGRTGLGRNGAQYAPPRPDGPRARRPG